MIWPFISRKLHESRMEVMRANLDGRSEMVSALQEVIEHKNGEIAILTQLLVAQKCNDYTPKVPEKPKMTHVPSHGRGGWRHKSEEASKKTFPKPKDSARALDERVKEQGGI